MLIEGRAKGISIWFDLLNKSRSSSKNVNRKCASRYAKITEKESERAIIRSKNLLFLLPG
jgi:hypothetical protein